MRKLSMLVGFVLALALVSGYAFAAPMPAAGSGETLVPDNDGDKGDEAKKPKKDRTNRGKWARKASGSKKPKSKPKYKPWKKVLKDSEKDEGLFDVHTKREDVFFEIKEDQLDKPFVTFMSLSKGIGARFVLGGLPIAASVMFDFHRVEDHIQIRQLNTRFRATDDEALDNAIDLTFGNSVLFNLPIASENKKEKALLIKMNNVFLSDISDMGFWLQLALRKPVRMDKKKAVYRKVKAFPENIEVEALLTYSPGDRRGLNLPSVPDSRYIEIGVHYSIHMLPEHPMKPRLADDRVGYFMTPHKDFAKDASENFFVHYINRWRLEKKDPHSSLSEPVQPIVFYLDTTIPQKYRKYVAQGIEMWQKAYEAAGFKNAIIAKEVGDDPDYDAEDARYNTIRWIISDEPSFGAIGPSRVDPRTGEILDADILMEQNMLASFRRAYRRFSGPEAFVNMDPMMRYLKDPSLNPEIADEEQLREHFLGSGATCDIGFGFALNFEFMQLALLADGLTDGMDVPMDYVGEALAFVTAHEVGHTLGLRHNFKSSTSTPYDKLNDRRAIEDIGMTGSVMDYPSPNVSRDRGRQGYYYTPSIGTYDQWAITFGYEEIPGDKSPEHELWALKSVSDRASEKRHLYGTDEDTYPAGALDPNSMIWDLGDDPLAWAEERIGVCRDILHNDKLVKRVVGEGENYVPLRNAVVTLLVQEYLAAQRATKFIGAQHTARPHLGDHSGELPLMPVSAAEQRKALDFIVTNAFAKDAFAVSPEILNKLADDKLWSWQNNIFQRGRRFDFPLHGWVEGLQNALVVQLLNPMRLQRMVDAEYKSKDPYKLAELFRTLTSEIWTKNVVPSGHTAAMQRNLQRSYLDHLIRMTVTPPAGTPWEAVALSRLQLTRLQSRINTAYQRPGLSDEANAHLLESQARIARALDAKLDSSF